MVSAPNLTERMAANGCDRLTIHRDRRFTQQSGFTTRVGPSSDDPGAARARFAINQFF